MEGSPFTGLVKWVRPGNWTGVKDRPAGQGPSKPCHVGCFVLEVEGSISYPSWEELPLVLFFFFPFPVAVVKVWNYHKPCPALRSLQLLSPDKCFLSLEHSSGLLVGIQILPEASHKKEKREEQAYLPAANAVP